MPMRAYTNNKTDKLMSMYTVPVQSDTLVLMARIREEHRFSSQCIANGALLQYLRQLEDDPAAREQHQKLEDERRSSRKTKKHKSVAERRAYLAEYGDRDWLLFLQKHEPWRYEQEMAKRAAKSPSPPPPLPMEDVW